ncbi:MULTISPECIES: hypothetical protein [unclassified Bradyrhizobium]|uniref:hypothetical protein n=1 Tax=unclassified Bradyrhizobium TaxID=2631580 RepID=UPI002303E14D|nr:MULTISPECIES: hypothetical protein [unclassified Bradyrhizobium]MDA9401039.1 hypothetical protein [Bradyrhizobium sp. CCBAU 45389]MDA9437172.1 hypothetical protein [Bradyrhizobium sp. CCBAU 51627]MDA9527431.1 hypothetical protein [Bradyrhizobium sp. CCBAU 25338]
MPVDLKAFAKGVEEQIKQIRDDLAPLEAGKMTIGEREGNGPWRDVTQDMVKHHKSSLRTYELILADLRARIARGE